MEVNTTRFGVVEVEPEQLISFPQGMVGFPELKEYFFVPLQGTEYFVWMQAKDDPDVAFLMTDPFLFFPDYRVELSDSVCEFLQLREPRQATVLAVVTIPPEGVCGMTANLLAPVVINHEKRLGQQVILESSGYRTRHPLFGNLPPASSERACG
ncbi:MAG: Flagellar assembly factor FliW [Thermoanaerobacterales bacterium 50_218]|nr:MAG: Flagellar assembly factor FliW [Thermoanaerobacterales bacterium 50_218]HAA89120.1 flagellar assembly protein FliW [Peptococcaceae bacterium]